MHAPSLMPAPYQTARTRTCKPTLPTVGALLEFYIQHHVAYLKNRIGTEHRLRRYVSEFASIPLDQLSRRMVIEWYHRIARDRGETGATQALQQLRSMYAKGQEWEFYAGPNPADRIKKFPKRSRTRFVTESEMPALLRSLAQEPLRNQAFFMLLLFTGARRDEARTAQWTDFDLTAGLWHKPTTKTGIPHTIPLAPDLLLRLAQLERTTAYVFSSKPNGKNGGRPGCWCQTSTEYAWRRIRRRAGLPDVRIHDLRRTCASWLAIHGENLSVIQRTLGHTTLAVTQVYARLTLHPIRKALDAQAERMLSGMPT